MTSDAGRLPVWEGHKGDGEVGYAIAIARTPAQVEEAKQASHDFVIEHTGPRRAGPVQWAIYAGQEGVESLRSAGIEMDPQILGFVTGAPEAVLVVAMVATDTVPSDQPPPTPAEQGRFTELTVHPDVERDFPLDTSKLVATGRLTAIGMLRHGTNRGRATVSMVVTLPDGSQVFAETTWACLRTAYAALAASPIVAEEVVEP